MKLKKDFILRQLADEYVVFPVGEMAVTNMIVELNETGAYLWKLLVNGSDRESMIRWFAEHYEIDHETAAGDVDYMLSVCREHELLEEDDDAVF